jgi:sugar phosphate permease
MFTKKYFQDRTILFLNIAIAAITLLNVIAAIIRIDTTKQVEIIRYQTTEQLAGYSRADAIDLYSFAVASLLFTVVAVFLSAKFFTQKRMMSVLLLSLTLIVLIFTFVVSNAIYNLR